MKNNLTNRDWLILVTFLFLGPILALLVHGYWVLLFGPAVQAFGYSLGPFPTILIMNHIGFFLAALAICVPLMWLTNKRPLFFGAVIGFTTMVIVLLISAQQGYANLSNPNAWLHNLPFVAECMIVTALFAKIFKGKPLSGRGDR